MPTVNSGGVEIDYEVVPSEGKGAPVFFLSGLGGQRSSWARQIEPFAQRGPVVLHDHRGTGRSAKLAGVYTVPSMAGDVIAIMDAEGMERAHLVGSSTGGAIAQVLCIDHPNRVRSAVIMSSWVRADAFFIRQFTMRRRVLLEMGTEAYTRISALSLHFPIHFTKNFEAIQAREEEQIRSAPPPEVMAERIDAILAHDQADRLGWIRVPVLVAVAQDDACTPLYYSEQLAAAIPGAKLKVFETGGHLVYMSRSEEVNAVLLDFLRQHEP